ncbi:DUF7146 domain-containing protein [Azomonas macrocytogenes]|uniref:Phage/plasmid primase-like uncharacterized protein n=1 Tax=Azomonas macrocytogenes TaxID=69962 RepID=A0A839T6I2_AZOMA|nr:phage/plasmid primase-like uncharacterized protein [Azomonas macrocytogenes]
MSYYYKAETVRQAIAGQWLFVLASLAPELEPALRKPGRHVPCPIHGGKDGFRLFKDAHETGGGVCNTCGTRHDGFELLMWLRGWSFDQCLMEVGDNLNAEKLYRKAQRIIPPAQQDRQKLPEAKTSRFSSKGELVNFGPARYEHKPENEMSYFATLQSAHGIERTIWGVDIERALTESGATCGDKVTMLNRGREAVTVVREVLDDHGELLHEESIATHRNTWEVINHSAVREHEQTETTDRLCQAQSNGGQSASRLRVVACEQPIREEETLADEEASASTTGVVPLFKETQQGPDWLHAVQTKMEQQTERRKRHDAQPGTQQLKILKVWDECLPIASEIAAPLHRYFQERKVLVRFGTLEQGDSIRFHPNLPYWEENAEGRMVEVGTFPAIVTAIRDVDGQLITLHRTYLSNHGKKAKVAECRKMMSVPEGLDLNGGAIPLAEPVEGILGLAEGLETALSAYRATGIATWSTVNAQLMKTFECPEGVHTVIIWADRDRSRTGEVAANVLKARLEANGISVIVLLPQLAIAAKAKGIDWNDVLVGQGILGFPPVRQLRSFIENRRSRSM